MNPIKLGMKVIQKDGKIGLQYKGDVTISNFDNAPRDGWYGSIVLGGVLEGDKVAYQPQPYPWGEGRKLVIGPGNGEFNVPYATKWKNIKFSTNGSGVSLGQMSEVFKPLGVLLRLSVHNQKQNKKVHLKSVTVDPSSGFIVNSYISPKFDRASLENGAYPVASKRGENKALLFVDGANSAQRNINPGEHSAPYIFWAITENGAEKTEIKLTVAHGWNGPWKYNYTIALPKGYTGVAQQANVAIKPDGKIYRQLMPLDFFAKTNVTTGHRFADSDTDLGITITPSQFLANPNYSQFDGYRIPDFYDWYSIFMRSTPGNIENGEGPNVYLTGPLQGANHLWGNDKVQKASSFNGGTFDYPYSASMDYGLNGARYQAYSDWHFKKTTGTVSYALRYFNRGSQDSGNHDLRSAWRYEFTNNQIRVEAVFLGAGKPDDISGNNNDATTLLNHISSENFWNKAREYGEVNSRNFPIAPTISKYWDCYYVNRRNGGDLVYMYNHKHHKGVIKQYNSTYEYNRTYYRMISNNPLPLDTHND